MECYQIWLPRFARLSQKYLLGVLTEHAKSPFEKLRNKDLEPCDVCDTWRFSSSAKTIRNIHPRSNKTVYLRKLGWKNLFRAMAISTISDAIEPQTLIWRAIEQRNCEKSLTLQLVGGLQNNKWPDLKKDFRILRKATTFSSLQL